MLQLLAARPAYSEHTRDVNVATQAKLPTAEMCISQAKSDGLVLEKTAKGYKGVTKVNPKNPRKNCLIWRATYCDARTHAGQKKVDLGRFLIPEEAALAYAPARSSASHICTPPPETYS
eukprot:448479-Prymnesium_polylepis.1